MHTTPLPTISFLMDLKTALTCEGIKEDYIGICPDVGLLVSGISVFPLPSDGIDNQYRIVWDMGCGVWRGAIDGLDDLVVFLKITTKLTYERKIKPDEETGEVKDPV